MKTRLMISLLLSMPFACAGDVLGDGAEQGEEVTREYLVSTGAKDKALLMRVFDAVRKLEEDKSPKGARALEVRNRISSTEFLVTAGGISDYWFIALEPKDWDNRHRFRTDAEFTGATKSFRNESGETITVKVMKETPTKPGPPFTKDDFVRRLKDGETWTLMDFEQRPCKSCGGDGMAEQGDELVECSNCIDGRLSVDYLVKWW